MNLHLRVLVHLYISYGIHWRIYNKFQQNFLYLKWLYDRNIYKIELVNEYLGFLLSLWLTFVSHKLNRKLNQTSEKPNEAKNKYART